MIINMPFLYVQVFFTDSVRLAKGEDRTRNLLDNNSARLTVHRERLRNKFFVNTKDLCDIYINVVNTLLLIARII